MNLDLIDVKDLIKIIFICVFSYFTYFKITNRKSNNKYFYIVALGAIVSAIVYNILNHYIDTVLAFFATMLIYSTTLRIIIKDEIKLYIVSLIFSILIVYLIYLLGTFVMAVIASILVLEKGYKSEWFVIPIILFSILMYYGLFKIKRFKNGFNFLNNSKVNKRILIFLCVLWGIILIALGFSKNYTTVLQQNFILIGTLIIIATLFIIVRKLITKYYKKHMRDRTIEMQKREIDEQLENLENVKAENIRLATIIHKYNSRISALEKGITKALDNMNTEFAGELAVMLDETKGISKELEEQTKKNMNVPSTGIFGIDNMFQHMNDECIENNINFSLKITDSINYLIENVVKKEKLETLIGDHIKDAIIAINSGTPEYKSILCILGIVRDCYEFSVYDTGIDFEIDTLLKLGVEQVTTHKDTGGSGIGFVTTFETMKECGASLIIEEYDKKTTHYTKSVTIRFDGKNEYRIYSHRYKEIKKASKDKRIVIHNIE